MPPSAPRLLELDASASAFLDLILELGHIDDAMLQVINDRLLDLDDDQAPPGLRRVTLDDVRRIATGIILDRLPETDLEYQRALDREWPLLFG